MNCLLTWIFVSNIIENLSCDLKKELRRLLSSGFLSPDCGGSMVL